MSGMGDIRKINYRLARFGRRQQRASVSATNAVWAAASAWRGTAVVDL